METNSQRLALQDAMVFLGAIASGTEQAIGESANSISYLAGVNLGKKLSQGVPHTGDIEQALAATREVLDKNDYLWLFEPFQTHDQASLVQKGSLCNMMYGFFAGALQNIMGRESSLEIIHAGENACYKKLTVKRG